MKCLNTLTSVGYAPPLFCFGWSVCGLVGFLCLGSLLSLSLSLSCLGLLDSPPASTCASTPASTQHLCQHSCQHFSGIPHLGCCTRSRDLKTKLSLKQGLAEKNLGVPTTPDPNASAKVLRYKWEAYRDTNWWCMYYFLPKVLVVSTLFLHSMNTMAKS